MVTIPVPFFLIEECMDWGWGRSVEVLRWHFLFLGGTLSQQFQKINEPWSERKGWEWKRTRSEWGNVTSSFLCLVPSKKVSKEALEEDFPLRLHKKKPSSKGAWARNANKPREWLVRGLAFLTVIPLRHLRCTGCPLDRMWGSHNTARWSPYHCLQLDPKNSRFLTWSQTLHLICECVHFSLCFSVMSS